MHVESVQIQAEAYDVALDISFPKGKTKYFLCYTCISYIYRDMQNSDCLYIVVASFSTFNFRYVLLLSHQVLMEVWILVV